MFHPFILERIYDIQQLLPLIRRVRLGFCTGVLACVLLHLCGLEIEIAHLRALHVLRGARDSPNQIVIVGIDELTRAEFGVDSHTSLPRDLLARALSATAAAQPQLLIVDLALPPQTASLNADREIARALRMVPSTLWDGDLADLSVSAFPSDPLFVSAARKVLAMSLPAHKIIFAPMLDGHEADDYTAHASALPSVTSALRELTRIPLVLPPLRALINYYGPAGSIPHISVANLLKLSATERSSLLGGKVVIFGVHEDSRSHADAAMGSDEHFVTSALTPMSGTEIHATIAGNSLDGSWLHTGSPLVTLFGVIIFSGMLVRLLGSIKRPLFGFFGWSLCAMVALIASYYCAWYLHLFCFGLATSLLATLIGLGLHYLAVFHLELARLIRISLATGLSLATVLQHGGKNGSHSRLVGAVIRATICAALALLCLASQIPQRFGLLLLDTLSQQNPVTTSPPIIDVSVSDQTLSAMGISPGALFPADIMVNLLTRIAAGHPKLIVLDAGLAVDTHSPSTVANVVRAVSLAPVMLWDGSVPAPSSGRRVADPTRASLYNSDPLVRATAASVADLSIGMSYGVAATLLPFSLIPNRQSSPPMNPPLPELAALTTPRRLQLLRPYSRDAIRRFDASAFLMNASPPPVLHEVVMVGFTSVARQRGAIESSQIPVIGYDAPLFVHEVNVIRSANLLTGVGIDVLDSPATHMLAFLGWCGLIWQGVYSQHRRWYHVSSLVFVVSLVGTVGAFELYSLWIPAVVHTISLAGVVLVLGICIRHSGLSRSVLRLTQIVRIRLSSY